MGKRLRLGTEDTDMIKASWLSENWLKLCWLRPHTDWARLTSRRKVPWLRDAELDNWPAHQCRRGSRGGRRTWHCQESTARSRSWRHRDPCSHRQPELVDRDSVQSHSRARRCCLEKNPCHCNRVEAAAAAAVVFFNGPSLTIEIVKIWSWLASHSWNEDELVALKAQITNPGSYPSENCSMTHPSELQHQGTPTKCAHTWRS